MALEEWEIDTMHSGIYFSVRHMVVAKVRGHFDRWRASFLADDTLERTSLEVVIDASSIRTGWEGRDAHLKSPAFLDVARYPEITFTSSGVEKLDDGSRFRLTGSLTMRDVARVVVFEVDDLGRTTDKSGQHRAGFVAKTTLDRNDFGITWNETLEAGGYLVGALVEVEVEIEAIRRLRGMMEPAAAGPLRITASSVGSPR